MEVNGIISWLIGLMIVAMLMTILGIYVIVPQLSLWNAGNLSTLDTQSRNTATVVPILVIVSLLMIPVIILLVMIKKATEA